MLPPNSPPIYVPDDSPPITPGNWYPPRDDPAGVIAEADECYTQACKKIRDDIDAALREPESIYRHQTAIIAGEIGNLVDQVERVYLSKYFKAQSDARDALSRAYMAAGNLGIPTPTDLGVKIGIESGQELRSNWLREINGDVVTIGYPDQLLGPDPFALPDSFLAGDKPPSSPPPPIDPGFDCLAQDMEIWLSQFGPGWALYYDPPGPPQGYEIIKHPNCPGGAYYYAKPSSPPPGPPPDPPPKPPIILPDGTPCYPGGSPPPPSGPPPKNKCYIDTAMRLFGLDYYDGVLTKEQDSIVKFLCDYGGVCPVPPKEVTPRPDPPRADKLKLPNWCSTDIATELQSWQRIMINPAQWIKDLLQLEPQTPPTVTAPPWLMWTKHASIIKTGWVADFINLLIAIIDGFEEGVRLSNESLGESTTANLFTETVYAFMKWLNGWIGFPPGSWLRSLEKTINWQAPEEIPTVGDAMEGFLSGVFDHETSEAYLKGNNQCPEPMWKITHGRRSRANINEVTALFMQEKITEVQWRKKLRELGVTEKEEQDEFRKLVDAYPQPPDLVRFMMRDAADEEIVSKYKYDTDFENKFRGQIATYAKAVGLNEKEARLYWRAHWEIPSNTQLFEMLHRLRPGVVSKEIEVTYEDVKQAIQVNDLAPFWVERIMATSYASLTRTDVQRAFFIGAMDEKEVNKAFQDIGYNAADAATLTKFTKQLKNNQDRSRAGLPAPKEWVNRFVTGEVGYQEAANGLTEFGWSPELVTKSMDTAKQKREAIIRRETIESVKAQYLRAQLSYDQALSRQIGIGLDTATGQYNLERWNQARQKKNKVLSGTQLCRAFEMGLLTVDQYQDALFGSGYTMIDVQRIMSACGADVNLKRAKQAEAAQKKAEKARKDAEREMEKIEKKRCEAEKRKASGKPAPC